MEPSLSEIFGMDTVEFAARIAKHTNRFMDLFRNEGYEEASQTFVSWFNEDPEEQQFKAIAIIKLFEFIMSNCTTPVGQVKLAAFLAQSQLLEELVDR